MRNLNVTIYHPSLSDLSDRTFRSLLKEVSRRLNRIHREEVSYLIDSFSIANSQRQSLRDRVEHKLSEIPNYYVRQVKRSSLTLAVMFTGVAIWALQNTIGKSIEEAWKQSDAHRQIVKYLTTDLRERRIEELIHQQFPEGGIITSFRIVEVSFDRKPGGDLNANIEIESPVEIETKVRPLIDSAFVVRRGRSIMSGLPRKPPGPKKH